ncbi:ead/Ea22-like family protein [Enterobacter soli]|uniref:ead/Ea22-like family protein n=1 Tax=Enterobacter soli TaxID=885040 RepID=UPI002F40E1A9
MSNINKQARDKLKAAVAKAVDNFSPHMFVMTGDVLALLDELEAKDKLIDILRQDKDKVIDTSKERISKLLARVAELEAAENRTVEMPTFDGYVPHVARELQAGFRIACDNAGINLAASSPKGE